MEMSPTSRNTLKIGAALILIALLLVCGPIGDRMGLRGGSVEEAPSVAAGPQVDPIDTSDAVEAAAAGGLVGASFEEVDETDVAALGDVKTEDASSVVAAGVAAGAAGAAAGAGAAGDSGKGGAGPLPPASARVPATDVASGGISEADAAVAAMAAAAQTFNDSLDSAIASHAGAGPAAARFAPPVAADGLGQSFASTIEVFDSESGDFLRPCDSPGSGCQNLNAGGGGPIVIGGAITPFGPGSPRGPR
jgi:hypothetical protein